MKTQGQLTLPPIISDGWGGIREAIVNVYGQVPAYKGRGRRPTKPRALADWQYLQMVKKRDSKGKLLAIEPKAIFGNLEDLTQTFGEHTAYIERTHLSMRQANARLTRKTLCFSKDLALHQAAALWDDATYNFVKPLGSLRIDLNPHAERFHPRYEHATPAMAAGLADHIWSTEELLRTVPIPTNSS
jgi:hypothetical protein